MKIVKQTGIVHSQAKGCYAFVHIGMTAYYIRTNRYKAETPFIDISIDTPYRRLNVKIGKLRFSLKTNAPGGGQYRHRWLQKLV